VADDELTLKTDSTMRICTARLNLRVVAGFSAAFCLALTFASLPAAAQQWTPQQRAACEPDAMRLCNQYIPDVQRVSACMSAYRRRLLRARRERPRSGAAEQTDELAPSHDAFLPADTPGELRLSHSGRQSPVDPLIRSTYGRSAAPPIPGIKAEPKRPLFSARSRH
jgi:hypothetical protein